MSAKNNNSSMARTRRLFMANKFPLLSRLSIASLVAMLFTAAILVFLYWQEQVIEHEKIALQENEKSATRLLRLFGGQINKFVASSEGLDEQELRVNPNIDSVKALLEPFYNYDILKLKIFNLSGKTAYSSIEDDIGKPSSHPDLLAKALRGELRHELDFRQTFISTAGELHDRYVASTYIPMNHSGKFIGVIELYTDATHIFQRIRTGIIKIALVVFCSFSVLYASLFFYVRKTDRAIAEWEGIVTQSEARYRSLFENMLNGFAYCKMQYDDNRRPVDFVYLNVNKSFGRLTDLKEVEGKSVSQVIPGALEQNPELLETYGRVALTGVPEVFDLDFKPLKKWFTISVYSPEKEHFVAIFDDITQRKRAEDALREQEEFFRMIAENVNDFIAVIDLDGRRIYNNPSYANILGDTEALRGTDSFAEIHPDDREHIRQIFRETVQSGVGQRAEFRFLLANGDIRHMESCGGLIKNSRGEALRVVVVAHDITERVNREKAIHDLAFHDTLTQLPNRRLLSDRLEQTMAASKRSGLYCALLFLDLDNFKPLNDEYGHELGDLLLVEAAHRINSCVREIDTVARFGGDEFVVVLHELDRDKAESAAQARIVAEKIRAALAKPYLLASKYKGATINPVEYHCTSSIGVILFINHEVRAEDIIKSADMAMYQAKGAGRNHIHFYDTTALATILGKRAVQPLPATVSA